MHCISFARDSICTRLKYNCDMIQFKSSWFRYGCEGSSRHFIGMRDVCATWCRAMLGLMARLDSNDKIHVGA